MGTTDRAPTTFGCRRQQTENLVACVVARLALHGARLSNPYGPMSQQMLCSSGKRTVRRAVTLQPTVQPASCTVAQSRFVIGSFLRLTTLHYIFLLCPRFSFHIFFFSVKRI